MGGGGGGLEWRDVAWRADWGGEWSGVAWGGCAGAGPVVLHDAGVPLAPPSGGICPAGALHRAARLPVPPAASTSPCGVTRALTHCPQVFLQAAVDVDVEAVLPWSCLGLFMEVCRDRGPPPHWAQCPPPPKAFGPGGGSLLSSDLDLDFGADLKAHRTPGEEHNGFPDDSAYRPASPPGVGQWRQANRRHQLLTALQGGGGGVGVMPTPQGCIGRGEVSPPPSRAPSLCPATVPLMASAGVSGIRNRQ